MSDTKNTLIDNGVLAETEESRGMNIISIEAPTCEGEDRIKIRYETKDDKIAFDVFDLITSKIGLKMTIEPTRKGGGG